MVKVMLSGNGMVSTPRIELIATPFPEGKNGMVVYFQTDDDDLGQRVYRVP